jgi:hypothetical protein
MNHDDIRALLLTGVPTGGLLCRWWVLRRRSPEPASVWLPARIGRWCLQIATANVRLAQLQQVERATRATLATTTADFTACRAENDRLRATLDRLRAADGSPISGAGSSIAPTAQAGAKRPAKRSPKVTPTS